MKNFSIEANRIWEKATLHTKGSSLEESIELQSKILKIFMVGDYYYYIFNVNKCEFEYISPEIEEVLGYVPEEMNVGRMLKLIHPDDQPWFLNFENKIVDFFFKATSRTGAEIQSALRLPAEEE